MRYRRTARTCTDRTYTRSVVPSLIVASSHDSSYNLQVRRTRNTASVSL